MLVVDVQGYQAKTKWVTVTDITIEADTEILTAALQAARETRSSIFNYKVERSGGTARVRLDID